MDILFVCVGNVGRSQIAEAFFNQSSQHQATSAGLGVGDADGQTVGERALSRPGSMLQVVREEEGLDLSAKLRNQLTPELVARADRVIVIAPEAEYPPYLEDNKVTFWDVQDIAGEPQDRVHQLKEQIKERVRLLVQDIG